MTNFQYLMGTPALAAQFESCCTDYRELRDWLEEEME